MKGIVQGLRYVLKEFQHLVLGLEVEPGIETAFVIGEAKTVGIAVIGLRLQRQEEVMGFAILFIDVVDIVGGDHLEVMLLGHPQATTRCSFSISPRVWRWIFNVIVLLAKEVHILLELFLRQPLLLCQ